MVKPPSSELDGHETSPMLDGVDLGTAGASIGGPLAAWYTSVVSLNKDAMRARVRVMGSRRAVHCHES
jgi:hypothetical protein